MNYSKTSEFVWNELFDNIKHCLKRIQFEINSLITLNSLWNEKYILKNAFYYR